MAAKGYTDRGRPSMRRLGEAAGVVTTTVVRMVFGQSESDVATVRAVADALGISPAVVSEWAGRARAVYGPWTPPAAASQLSPRQRTALDELIRAMTESEATDDGAPIALHVNQVGEQIDVEATPPSTRTRRGRGAKQAPSGQ